ncbi:hypothetical protein [Marinobacter sp.]|uniref:hypothetical protein n=1 Tax=Marinobacter sp. TaxID=50741 RepID=UPI001B4C52CD|nr:hypothetical protein [Marinobacter sp.]MBQ0834316.1 hypothetical protein [Marinobacter sp.]
MRWFALALVVLNVGVWQLSDSVKVGVQPAPAAYGNLPRVASLKVQVEPARSAQSLPGERACVTIGWIESLEAARALAENRFFTQGSDLSVEKVDRPLPSLHWVIVPPQPPGAALEQFQDMQNQGIDSYLVTEGENKNAISLGLFESRNAAISVLEEKKHQNLNAVLANFPRNQISYALSFEVSSEFVEEQIQAVEADYGVNFDFIEIKACEGVATPEKNP